MSHEEKDVFSRLTQAIEAWNAQWIDSHQQLATQIDAAQGHLNRLFAVQQEQAPVPGVEEAAENAADSNLDTLLARSGAAEAALASLRAQIDDQEAQNACLSEENFRLAAEVESLRDSVSNGPSAEEAASSQQQLAHSQHQLTAMLAAANELERVTSEQDETIRALKEERDAIQGQAEELRLQIEELQSRVSHVDTSAATELDASREIVARLEAQYTASVEEISALQEALEAAGSELQQYKELAASESGLQSQVTGLKNRAAELEEQLASAREEIARLQEAFEASEETCRQTLNELDRLRSASTAPAPAALEDHPQYQALIEYVAELEGELALSNDAVRAARKPSLPSEPDLPVSIEPDDSPIAPHEAKRAAFDRAGHKRMMGDILLDLGILTGEQLQGILAEQAEHPQKRFGNIATERGYTSERLIAEILAAQLHLECVDLTKVEIDPAAISTIPKKMAQQHSCLPYQRQHGTITVAMANPMDLIAIENIELASRLAVTPVVATSTSIVNAIEKCFEE
ncbi:MAG: hypothetical protein HYV27_22285 [Candidatus Hydrogenedentes bacterium]|nr:hypothetical protein [Candidatus Hydrogenedentota bacterium]